MLNFFYSIGVQISRFNTQFRCGSMALVIQLDSGADEPEFLSQSNIYNIKLQ